MTKLKPCPICGIGKPRMVHYALPLKYNPDAWQETEDCLLEPKMTYKRIECSNCGASTVIVSGNVNTAIKDWNYVMQDGKRPYILQFIIDEELEVEE